MNDEITQDRSPRAPGLPLQAAIEQARKLHRQIGRASVKPEVAAKALGFTGLTGSSLSNLATLSQYGLIDRAKGLLSLSPLAVRLLHPTSPEQFEVGVRAAALSPSIFQEIFRDLNDCSSEVLQSHLVQTNFSPPRARRVAQVYTANKEFAKLAGDSNVAEPEGDTDLFGEPSNAFPSTPAVTTSLPHSPKIVPSPRELETSLGSTPTSATPRYTVPLSSGEIVTLTFSTDNLFQEDFEKLIRYVKLFQEDFPKRISASPVAVPVPDPPVVQGGGMIDPLADY